MIAELLNKLKKVNIGNVLKKRLYKIPGKYRLSLLNSQKRNLVNSNFTILSNNCIGGIIYKDLGITFTSPTINLFFFAPDYIRFLSKLDYYLSVKLKSACKSKYGKFRYPVGMLDDLEIHFVHYVSFEEAEQKWETRKKRVNKDNIFIIGSDRDLCTPAIIEAFNNLPYENKIFLSSKSYPELRSVVWLKKYKNCKEIPDIIPAREWLKYIDLIAWLNKEKNFIKAKLH